MATDLLVLMIALGLGGILKGATGVGLPVIAVPAIAAFSDVPFALAVMTVPLVTTNAWQLWTFRANRGGLPFLPWLLASGAAGIALGTWILTELPEERLSLGLAVVIVVYIGLRLLQPDFRLGMRAAMMLSPLVGLLAGALQGATGISAPVSITFVNALHLERPRFVFAMSALFLMVSATQVAALAIAGILDRTRLLYGCLALLPIAVMMPVGAWLAARMSRAAFDRVILGLLAAIAVKLFHDSGVFAVFA